MEQKGVSPVVGTILLIAITVALAAVVATLVSGLGGRGTPPSAMLTVVAENDGENLNITISHEGGDDLATQDLEIKVDDETKSFPTVDPTLTVGESITIEMHTTAADVGDVLTVYIIHVPSKQKIFSSSSVVVRD
jgi:flagellin-like protein